MPLKFSHVKGIRKLAKLKDHHEIQKWLLNLKPNEFALFGDILDYKCKGKKVPKHFWMNVEEANIEIPEPTCKILLEHWKSPHSIAKFHRKHVTGDSKHAAGINWGSVTSGLGKAANYVKDGVVKLGKFALKHGDELVSVVNTVSGVVSAFSKPKQKSSEESAANKKRSSELDDLLASDSEDEKKTSHQVTVTVASGLRPRTNRSLWYV